MFLKLARNSKVPVKGDWQLTEEPAEFLSQRCNAGLTLKNMTVVDFDDKPSAREWYRKYSKIITTIVETRRGAHFYFANETKARRFEFGDIKSGEHSYVVVPPSVVDGFRYRLVQCGILQPFPEHLFPAPKHEARHSIDENDPVRRLVRAREWMKRRDAAIDGEGGGTKMLKTCRALFAMFGLSEDQVWPLILEYNERCEPPFNEKELRHKIEDSKRKLK